MHNIQRISDVRPFQKPQDSIFSYYVNRRISRACTFVIVRLFPWMTPSMISVLSLIISLAGIALFLHPSYGMRLFGVLLLQFGFSLDCSDGEVARIQNSASAFGAWLDSVFDRFKEAAMLGALTVFWFEQIQPDVKVLYVGFGAIIGWLLVAYLREAKKSSWQSKRSAELFISKNVYIGTVDTSIWLVSAAVILHVEYYSLILFLLLSIPLILKQIRSAHRLGTKS